MNPMIDVGQVEGAFVMGLGFWLTEQIKFDSTTGRLLTNSTWVSVYIPGRKGTCVQKNIVSNAPANAYKGRKTKFFAKWGFDHDHTAATLSYLTKYPIFCNYSGSVVG